MRTLVGTPLNVSRQLADMDVDQVIAVIIKDMNPHTADVLADTLVEFIQIFRAVQASAEAAAIPHVPGIEIESPAEPRVETRVIELLMRATSRIAVLAGTQWLTAEQVGQLEGFGRSDPGALLNRWQQEHKIFALSLRDVNYFPAYGLDSAKGHRPIQALAKVMEILGEVRDGWGQASWFLSVNSFLGGRRPQDLLATEPERVIAAAEDERNGVTHG